MALPKIVQDINDRVSFAEAQTLTDAQKAQARANIGSAENNVAPIGSYMYFAGDTVPNHYLLCNGAAVSRSDYADLYVVIGDTYGAGDGSTTFNLPNAIDKFLEGSGTAGTVKNAGLPNITGGMSNTNSSAGLSYANVHEGALTKTPVGGIKYPSEPWNSSLTDQNCGIGLDASLSNSIYGNSSTVQPPALTALPCIRYE